MPAHSNLIRVLSGNDLGVVFHAFSYFVIMFFCREDGKLRE
jgi:hypothetical protein